VVTLGVALLVVTLGVALLVVTLGVALGGVMVVLWEGLWLCSESG
jgi:hypothetical protein